MKPYNQAVTETEEALLGEGDYTEEEEVAEGADQDDEDETDEESEDETA